MLVRIWPRLALGGAHTKAWSRILGASLATVMISFPTAASAQLATGNEARPSIEFSAEASQTAANDLGVATLYAEGSGDNAAELALGINQRMVKALAVAHAFASVKAQSGGVSTWPVYAKDGQGRIEAWRMRSEIRIESRDLGALSELIGKLQTDLALSQVVMQPAPETRRKAVEEATVSAIRAFEQRAALIAHTLGKGYRIAHMSIGDSGFQPPMPIRMRAAPAGMLADSAPAPLEGGESQIGVSISGRIDLLE